MDKSGNSFQRSNIEKSNGFHGVTGGGEYGDKFLITEVNIGGDQN
jgi:hypothetical protein